MKKELEFVSAENGSLVFKNETGDELSLALNKDNAEKISEETSSFLASVEKTSGAKSEVVKDKASKDETSKSKSVKVGSAKNAENADKSEKNESKVAVKISEASESGGSDPSASAISEAKKNTSETSNESAMSVKDKPIVDKKKINSSEIQSVLRMGYSIEDIVETYNVSAHTVESLNVPVETEKNYALNMFFSSSCMSAGDEKRMRDVIYETLSKLNVPLSGINWTAKKAKGFPWSIELSYKTPTNKDVVAVWNFNISTRSAIAQNDEAKMLTSVDVTGIFQQPFPAKETKKNNGTGMFRIVRGGAKDDTETNVALTMNFKTVKDKQDYHHKIVRQDEINELDEKRNETSDFQSYQTGYKNSYIGNQKPKRKPEDTLFSTGDYSDQDEGSDSESAFENEFVDENVGMDTTFENQFKDENFDDRSEGEISDEKETEDKEVEKSKQKTEEINVEDLRKTGSDEGADKREKKPKKKKDNSKKRAEMPSWDDIIFGA